MEISARGMWTLIHGMGFGALYLLACSGALVELGRRCRPGGPSDPSTEDGRFLKAYLVIMAVLAWLTVFTGAYVIYPWYRAAAPPGVTDLGGYPQRLLLSDPSKAAWHSLGMEWKEHIAWLAPISITMVAAIVIQYGRSLAQHRQIYRFVLAFVVVSFLSAGVAGFFGAMIDKAAPVQGGRVITLGEARK